MSHTIRKKSQLLNRTRRLRGQVEAIERALEAEAECTDVLQLIASVRGAINGLIAEVMEEHIRHHVMAPTELTPMERIQGAEELVDVIRTYLK
jgi:DNA-binding FrmR family transcriptional regulator